MGNPNPKNQFGPGNTLGSRPKNSQVRMRQLILQELEADNGEGEMVIHDIIRTTARKAKQGDTAAAKLLLEYVAGKPSQHIEVDKKVEKTVLLLPPQREEQATVEDGSQLPRLEHDPATPASEIIDAEFTAVPVATTTEPSDTDANRMTR